ncbi:MAG: lysophospholipid acyltransferase family protein [bacterium]|nr:lysophospholipid acyltransferase family protein [bacterium]
MLLSVVYNLCRMAVETVPRGVSVRVGRLLADLFYLLDGNARRAVAANLSRVLESDGRGTATRDGRRNLRRLVRKTFENFAIHVVDFMRLGQIDTDIRIGLLRPEHVARFREALAEGRGLVSVTAHLGNWEMGASATARLGFVLSTVAMKMEDRRVDRFFSRLRRSSGIRVVPHGRAAREMVGVLRRGEVAAFVADRDVDGTGCPVPFFGGPVNIPRGPAEMAVRAGAPLVPTFCVQEPGGYFRITAEEPIRVADDLPHAEKVRRVNEAMVAVFERYIRRYPSQWFAFYKVWG